MTTPPLRPSSAIRHTRRSRRPAAGTAPFRQRHRSRLTWLAGLLGFLVLATAFFLNASRPTYACADQFNPTPAPSFVPPTPAPSRPSQPPATPSPTPDATTSPSPPPATPSATSPAPSGSAAPAPSGSAAPGPSASAAPSVAPTTPPTAAPVTPPPPGYVQMDQGAGHVDVGTTVRYPSCPPASGRHYNGVNVGPIRGGFYGLNDPAAPPGWVHNLEHGAIVLLYRCETPGSDQLAEACTDAGQQALRDMLARWPAGPQCGTAPGPLTPVIARFDDMARPYAAIVWDVILPLDTLDEAAIFDFYAQRGERFNPEPQCADATPTPGPTSAGGPSASPAASAASPAPSGAASPGASPGTSPAAPVGTVGATPG